jgi:hypothetical protein
MVDLAHPDHPAVSINVSGDARIAETEDGCYLDVSVRNLLPCVRKDVVSIFLVSQSSSVFQQTK